MREDFEIAAIALIEVDPFKRSNIVGNNPKDAVVGALDFSAGRGETGVYLRWYPSKDFKALSNEQQSELKEFMRSPDGKEVIRKSRASASGKCKRDKNEKDKSKPSPSGVSWKRR